MKQFLLTKLTNFRKDCAGGILVFFALAAPVLIGIAGLAIDTGMLYANKRMAQSAADAAALAGAFEFYRSSEDADAITLAVNLDALNHGYSAANGDTITVNTNGSRVEVIITRPVQPTLSAVIFPETTNVRARAVARAQLNDTCIWAINPDESGSVNIAGGATVDLGCGVLANSTDDAGIDENGTGCLTALEIKVVGGTEGDCINPTAETNIDPVDDPLAALEAPTFSECLGPGGPPHNFTGTADYVISPDTFCTNITISTTGTVTFLPGLYILDGVSLTISGQSNVIGEGVNFYLSANGSNSDNITIAGGANVELTAGTGGELPGILFYQDRDSSSGITNSFTGGSTMELNGIIYTPNNALSFTGGSVLNESALMIIADTVNFTGTSYIGDFSEYADIFMDNPLMLLAVLVE